MLRQFQDGDELAIKQLWMVAAQVMRADVPWHPSRIKQTAQGGICIVRSAEHGLLSGAVFEKHFNVGDTVILKFDPWLQGNDVAEAEFAEWLANIANDLPADSALNVWRAGPDNGILAAAGFSVIRRYWRMDRPSMEDLPPPSIPEDLTVVMASDPSTDLNRWVDLYDRAFEGEWQFVPGDVGSLQANFIAQSPQHCLAAVDQEGQPMALVLAFPLPLNDSDGRPQPVANVEVVCREPNRGGQSLGKNLLLEALARLRDSGCQSASLRSDRDSVHQSYKLYETLGFAMGLQWHILARPA